MQLFGAIAQEAQIVTAQLGYNRLQDLVGRADLLEQARLCEELDMTPLLQVAPRPERPAVGSTIGRALRRPRNHLTEIISDLVVRAIDDEEEVITYEDSEAISIDRALARTWSVRWCGVTASPTAMRSATPDLSRLAAEQPQRPRWT